MNFLDEAKAALSEQELNALIALTAKAASFETTPKEDQELAALKEKVHTAVNNRARMQELQSIVDAGSKAVEAMKASGLTRKEALEVVNKVYERRKPDTGRTLAVYPTGALMESGRISKKLQTSITEGGVEAFIASLEEFGRNHLREVTVAEDGPKAGERKLENLTALAKRTGLDYDKLKEALAV